MLTATEPAQKSVDETVRAKLLSFKDSLSGRCIITGGHFMLDGNKQPQLNPGTELSFQVAADVYHALPTENGAVLGLLFNNIGSTCGVGVCYTGTETDIFTLPNEYADILQEHDLDAEDVHLYMEKHLRNRGKKEFNKRVKKLEGVEEDEDGWWLREPSGQRFLLTRCSASDPYGTPACPLIMAAYILEQEREGFTSSLNYWYIDSDNFANIPNYFMIEKGYELAKLLGATMKVRNVYFTKDKVITNF
jgi:hypothetical protein